MPCLSLQVYVSPEADRAKAKAEGGTNSPGPVYRVQVCPQRRLSQGTHQFRICRRENVINHRMVVMESVVGRKIHERPRVMMQETLGRQFLSTMRSNGVVSFGTARREGMAKKASVPGPGAYKSDEAATQHSSGRVKFGTASRDAAERVYISAEHDKTSGGRFSALEPVPLRHHSERSTCRDPASTFQLSQCQCNCSSSCRRKLSRMAAAGESLNAVRVWSQKQQKPRR